MIINHIIIGSNTVIGTMAMIGCGISIGHHCVVAAHSFVNRDVPEHSIVAGVPAKRIGRVCVEEDGSVEFVYFSKNADDKKKDEEE